MEHKLGEVFKQDGLMLRVEKPQGASCDGCFFYPEGVCIAFSYTDVEACTRVYREDCENVIFKLIKEG